MCVGSICYFITILCVSGGYNETLARIGSCTQQPKCSQICLPRLNARRECGCLPGFYKFGDTGCNTREYFRLKLHYMWLTWL